MDELKHTQIYEVNASSGLNLRTEPTTKSKVILVMRNGSIVTLQSDEVHTSDEHEWLNIKYASNGSDEIGWAAREYLKVVENSTYHDEGDPIGNIRFRFGDPSISYSISTANFGKSIDTYFFTGTVGQSGKEITDAASGQPVTRKSDGAHYWTTQRNIDTMKGQSLITVVLA